MRGRNTLFLSACPPPPTSWVNKYYLSLAVKIGEFGFSSLLFVELKVENKTYRERKKGLSYICLCRI